MAVDTKSQVNFLKGLNLATGKTTVIPGSVVRNSNLVYTKRGSLVTVDGTSLWSGGHDGSGPDPITFGTSTNEVIYIGAVPYGPLGLLPIALTSNDIIIPGQRYGPFLYDISTNPANNADLSPPWNSSPFGLMSPQVINANNYAIFLFGNNVIPTYKDFYNNTPLGFGTTAVQLGAGGVLGAAHGVFHGGQVWIWNTYPYPSQNDGPSVLRACAFLADGSPDLTNFPVTFRAVIDANDGQEGMGCISFTSSEFGIAPTPTLVLFKNFSTYQVTGKFGDGSITITRAQTDMGCVAPRTIQFVPGFGIVRLTHFGVSLFDGVKDTLISEEIRPYFFRQEPDIAPMNWAAVKQAVACVTVNPPMYVLAIPVEGQSSPLLPYTNLTRLLCYDLVLKAWQVTDIPQSGTNFSGIGYIATLKLPNNVPLTLMGDAPVSGPQNFTALASNSGGSLIGGTYTVMVTAIMASGQETGPAQEQTATVTAGPNGSITVSIPALTPGATKFRVYVGNLGIGTESRYKDSVGAANVIITDLSLLTAGHPPTTIGVRRWLNGDQTWDQIDLVAWRARLPEVFGKTPASRVYFRRAVLRAKASTPPITGKFTISGVQQAVTVPNKPFVPMVPGALYGSGIYGYSTYGDAYPDLVLPFDVGVTGASANAEYSGAGPIEILSNDWHFVPRPEMGTMRVS